MFRQTHMPYGYRSKLGTPIIRWLKLNIVGPQSTAMAPDHPRHYPPQQPGSCRKAPQTGEDSDASWVFFGDFMGGFHGETKHLYLANWIQTPGFVRLSHQNSWDLWMFVPQVVWHCRCWFISIWAKRAKISLLSFCYKLLLLYDSKKVLVHWACFILLE